MKRDEVIEELKGRLGDRLLQLHEKSPRRIYVDVAPADVPEASRMMFEDFEARFQIASGVDTPADIEVLYHWALDPLDCLVTVRTRLDRERPELESITPVCPAAEWIEREMWELLGIQFHHHPDLTHLLLSDDWPEGKYPLRRDYRK